MSNPFDFNDLRPDADKADGVWTRCKLNGRDGSVIDTGTDLLLAYAVDNSPLRHKQAALTAVAQRLARGRALDDAELGDIIRRAAVGTVLKDWKNYRLNGQPVPFSPDAAEKAMLGSIQFADFVASFANNLDNFRGAVAVVAAVPTSVAEDDHDGEEVDASPEGTLKTLGAMV